MCIRNMAQSKMKKPSKELQRYFEEYSEHAKAYEWLAGNAIYRCNPGYAYPGCQFTLREYETQNFQIDFQNLTEKDKHILLMHVTDSLSETIGATRKTLGWFVVSYL
jgi:hypothetical protein